MIGDLHSVFLSAGRALVGAVSPSLRAVVIKEFRTRVHLTALYDGLIDDDDAEAMSIAETEIISDCASARAGDVTVDCVRLDMPAMLPDEEVWVYRRRELGYSTEREFDKTWRRLRLNGGRQSAFAKLLVAGHTALLGAISSSIRRVTIADIDESTVMNVYFDENVDNNETSWLSIIALRLGIALERNLAQVRVASVYLPYPRRMGVPDAHIVYERKEMNSTGNGPAPYLLK